jgi:hypothetical protein
MNIRGGIDQLGSQSRNILDHGVIERGAIQTALDLG